MEKHDDIIQTKVKLLKGKFALNSEGYLAEALFVADYERKLQSGSNNNYQLHEIDKPNRRLANIGDRFLKLVLAEEKYEISDTVQEINDFTNDNEKNKNLYELKLVDASNGYCMIEGVPCENTKQDSGGKDSVAIIATLTEALIGALYLEEFKRTGKTDFTRKFIKENIIRQ